MLEIDGSQKSGSGTILRLAIALAAIKGEQLHIHNIRQNRPKPGLKHQHLEAVLTAAKLCNAQIEGVELNSREIRFNPKKIVGGNLESEIGTAGNIPMLFMTVLPICLFAEKTVNLRVIKGGTDTRQAPTVNYLKNVFLPTLKKMGIDAKIEVQKYGYYPKGMGEASLTVKPIKNLKPLQLCSKGNIECIKGISICTFLSDRKVADRQAKTAQELLALKGYPSKMDVVNDTSNPQQKGSSIVLWAETDKGAIIGADAIGEKKKTAEDVGKQAAKKLIRELETSSTVDTHLSDMLIPYMSLAKEKSAYLTRKISDHLETNIWLLEKILKTNFKIDKVDHLYRIQKKAET